MNPCDPDILTSFVDGALTEAQRHRVAEHLAACPACADTVRAHRDIKRRLAASATLVAAPAGLASRIGTALDNLPTPNAGRLPGGRTGGAGGLGRLGRFGMPLSVAAVLTSAGLWLARPMWQPQPVDVQALMWHHRETLRPPVDATLLTQEDGTARRWIETRLGDASHAPRLAASLRGIGACRVDDAPTAIWMYDAGRPVSLIEVYGEKALPHWQPAPSVLSGQPGQWLVGTYGGYNAVIWKTGGRTYALVSELPPERLLRLLEQKP